MDSQRNRHKSPHSSDTSTRKTYRRKPSSSSSAKLPTRHGSVSSYYHRKSPIQIRSAPAIASQPSVPPPPVSNLPKPLAHTAIASVAGNSSDTATSRSLPNSVLKTTNQRADAIKHYTVSSTATTPTSTVTLNLSGPTPTYSSPFGRRTPNILRTSGNAARRLPPGGQFVAVQRITCSNTEPRGIEQHSQSSYIAVQKMPVASSNIGMPNVPLSAAHAELANITKSNSGNEFKGEPLDGTSFEQRITAVTLNEFTPISCVYSGFTHAHKNTMMNLARNFFSLYTPMIDSPNLTVLLVINYNKAICIEIQQRIFADFVCKLVPRMLENKVVPFTLEVKDVPQNWISQNKKVIEIHPHEINNVTTKFSEIFRDRDNDDNNYAFPLTVYLLIRRGYLMIQFVAADEKTDVCKGSNAFLRTAFVPKPNPPPVVKKSQAVQTEKHLMVPQQFMQMQREQMEQVASMQQQMQKVAQVQIEHMQRVGRMQLDQMQHFSQIAQQIRTTDQLSEHAKYVAQRQLLPAPEDDPQVKNITKYGISREVQTDELSLAEETIQMVRWTQMEQVLNGIEVAVHKLMSLAMNTVANMEVKLQKQKYEMQNKDKELAIVKKKNEELDRIIRNLNAGTRGSLSFSRDHDDRKDYRSERRSSEDKEGRRDDNKSESKSRDFSRNQRNERSVRSSGRVDRNERSDRSDRSERGERSDRSERSERSDRTERTDRSSRENRDNRGDHFNRDQIKKRRISVDESPSSSSSVGHQSIRKKYCDDDTHSVGRSIQPAIPSHPPMSMPLCDLKPSNLKISLPETETFYQKCLSILREIESKKINQDQDTTRDETVNLTEDDMPAVGDFLQFNDDDFFQFFNLPEFSQNEGQNAFSIPENSIATGKINQIINEHEIQGDFEFLDCFFT